VVLVLQRCSQGVKTHAGLIDFVSVSAADLNMNVTSLELERWFVGLVVQGTAAVGAAWQGRINGQASGPSPHARSNCAVISPTNCKAAFGTGPLSSIVNAACQLGPSFEIRTLGAIATPVTFAHSGWS
jgi:hypothetical protein